MSHLKIYNDADGSRPLRIAADGESIARELAAIGVRFERWRAGAPVAAGAAQDQVLDVYRAQVDALMAEGGYVTADVISIKSDNPDKGALRQKFLNEHTHSEDEIRFFVDGQGLFYLRAEGKVFAVLCQKNDLISVPAGMTHWFDMGAEPHLACIRIFTNPEGWVANYTGDAIAESFPRIESFVAAA